MVGVRVRQPSSALHAPYGIESADHMATIENGGDVEFCAIYLCRLGNAGVYLPPRRLKRKKGALPSMLTPVRQQKRRDRLMITLKSQLKWPFLRCSLDLKQVAFVP